MHDRIVPLVVALVGSVVVLLVGFRGCAIDWVIGRALGWLGPQLDLQPWDWLGRWLSCWLGPCSSCWLVGSAVLQLVGSLVVLLVGSLFVMLSFICGSLQNN